MESEHEPFALHAWKKWLDANGNRERVKNLGVSDVAARYIFVNAWCLGYSQSDTDYANSAAGEME